MRLPLRRGQDLYVRSMGKALRVVAITDSDAEANAYMASHDHAAVVACFGPLVLLADRHDRGVRIDQDAPVPMADCVVCGVEQVADDLRRHGICAACDREAGE